MNTEISMTIPSRRNSTLITTLVLTAVAVVIPFLISGYQRTLFQKGLLWIPAIFGVYILYSLLRQVHFGQSIFIGIGSYITAFPGRENTTLPMNSHTSPGSRGHQHSCRLCSGNIHHKEDGILLCGDGYRRDNGFLVARLQS